MSARSAGGLITAILTTVVPTILASSLVATVFSTFYSDYLNPVVCIDIEVSEVDKALVEVRNTGKQPAREFLLTIESSRSITGREILATDNVTSIKENQTMLSLGLPRFTYGDGSVIKVNISTDNKSSTPNKIDVYATFETGSTNNSYPDKKVCPEPVTSFFREYGLIIILLVLPWIVYIPLQIYLLRRQDRRMFIHLLIQELKYVRTQLEDNPEFGGRLVFWTLRKIILYYISNFKIFGLVIFLINTYIDYVFPFRSIATSETKVASYTMSTEYYVWDIKTYNSKIGIFRDMSDYIKIEDFYRSLKARNKSSPDNRAEYNEAFMNYLQKR
jgi:hypothetical protein